MLWFEFNNKKSTEFSSIVVQELPDIVRAASKYKKTEIEGRDGAIYDEIGLSDISKTIIIGLKNANEIDSINEWLIGSGDLILSNEPDKRYKAKFYEEIAWQRTGRFRVGKVKCLCEPYKYERYQEIVYIDNPNAININNKGNTISKPFFKITGTGTSTLLIDDSETITITFGEAESRIEIDSEKELCSINGTKSNRICNGHFPVFEPGTHVLTYNGGNITRIEVNTRSRWR